MITMHLGYHKTGTTWLQDYFFPRLTDVKYFSKKDIKKKSKLNVNTDILDESMAVMFIRETAPLIMGKDNFLISNENYMKSRTKMLLKTILKCIGPETRIVFTIRRQDNVMFSRWDWQNKSKVWYRKFDIYKELDRLFDTRDKSFLKDIFYYYDYNRLLDDTLEFFPKEQILFMSYEKLFKNTGKELRVLSDFMGVPFPSLNYKTLSKVKTALGEYTNSFKDQYSEFLGEIRKSYFDDNKEFSERTGIVLKQEGYYE